MAGLTADERAELTARRDTLPSEVSGPTRLRFCCRRCRGWSPNLGAFLRHIDTCQAGWRTTGQARESLDAADERRAG